MNTSDFLCEKSKLQYLVVLESLELEEAQISSKQFIQLYNRKIDSLILNSLAAALLPCSCAWLIALSLNSALYACLLVGAISGYLQKY